VPTVFAPDAKKAVNWNATTKVSLELVRHEGRQFAVS
jgi:predicted component of type VI protein secretion system